MFAGHWFWALLTVAVVLWYSTVTVVVAVQGSFDLRGMLRGLRDDHPAASDEKPGKSR